MLGERPDDFEYVQGPAAFLEAQICKGSKTCVVPLYLGCTARNSACNDWNPCIRLYVCQDNVASNPSGTPGLRSQWLSFFARGKSCRDSGAAWRATEALRATARVRSGVLASNLEKNAQTAQSLRLPCGNMNCRAAPGMKAQRQDTQDTEGTQGGHKEEFSADLSVLWGHVLGPPRDGTSRVRDSAVVHVRSRKPFRTCSYEKRTCKSFGIRSYKNKGLKAS